MSQDAWVTEQLREAGIEPLGSRLGDWALYYAGVLYRSIFPCGIDKAPIGAAVQHGCLDATNRIDRVRDWWTRFPDANIGWHLGADGYVAVDLDPGVNEAQVRAAFDQQLPETALEAATPRSGRHLIYSLKDGEVVSGSNGKVAPNCDIKSWHGYICVYPSATADGEYRWVNGSDARAAFRSKPMVYACNTRARQKSAAANDWIIEADQPAHVEEAKRWLREAAKPAVQGQGGDNATFAAAAMCKSKALSEDKALEVMWEVYNPQCRPPWQYEDLAVKVRNAYEYNSSPPGNCTNAYHTELKRLLFEPRNAGEKQRGEAHKKAIEDTSPRERAKAKQRARMTVMSIGNIENLPPAEWIIPDLFQRNTVAAIIGEPKAGKTVAAVDLGLTIAAGERNAHFMTNMVWRSTQPSMPVFYCLGEGQNVFAPVLRAWLECHNGGAMIDNFYVLPVPRLKHPDDFQYLCEEVRRVAPTGDIGAVFVDTLSKSIAGCNENSQEVMSDYTAHLDMVREELGGPLVATLHHSGRLEKGRSRGSNVLDADIATMLYIEKVSLWQRTATVLLQRAGPDGQVYGFRVREMLNKAVTAVPMPEAEKHTVCASKAGKKKQRTEQQRDDLMPSIRNVVLDVLRNGKIKAGRYLWDDKTLAEQVWNHPHFDRETWPALNTLKTKWINSGGYLRQHYGKEFWEPYTTLSESGKIAWVSLPDMPQLPVGCSLNGTRGAANDDAEAISQ